MFRSLFLCLAYLALLTLAIPWYWPEAEQAYLLGLPDWVFSVLIVGFLAACLTAWNLLSGEPDDGGDD